MALSKISNIPIFGISDSFVCSLLKLTGGKNGHGEARIYTGGDNGINEYICKKRWKLSYPHNYLEEIKPTLNDSSLFVAKKCDNRVGLVSKNVQFCQDKLVSMYQQNGKNDGKRCYVGPGRTLGLSNNEENVKLYDTFRKTILPKGYSLELIEEDDYFACNVINNNDISQVKTKSSSKASDEYLKYLTKHLLKIEIKCQQNGGEFQLRNPKNGYFWPVDGYHNCSIHDCHGTESVPCPYNNHIWEFQGDYFHGNPSKYALSDTFHGVPYDEKHRKDAEKKKFYEDHGYVLVCKWESEWADDKIKMRNEGKVWW